MSLGAVNARSRRRIAPHAPEHNAELLALWVAAWRATYADIAFEARCPWLLDHLAQLEAVGGRTLCLWEEEPACLAGFVTIDPATGWLDQLCVHPERFGGGVAQELLRAAREVSPSRVRLDVNADNTRALRFYEREGFVCVGDGESSKSGRRTLVLEWTPSRVSSEAPVGA
jgi:putative acetyltransferase